MQFTPRQKDLLLSCVDAELAASHQGDTNLSLAAAEGIEDDDAADQAVKDLRAELFELRKQLLS